MHIPTTMLNGAVCPVTLAVGASGVGCAAYYARKIGKKISSIRFAAITALIFALQMLNYPVQNGTSGHLIGAAIGVAFLGIPFAVLSMSIVLAVQAIFFGDGGVNALGANILNMALIGVGLAGFVYERVKAKGFGENSALAVAGFLSVMASAFACSVEISLSGVAEFGKVIPAMMSVHTLIGVGEAILTVVVVAAVNAYGFSRKANEIRFAVGAFGLALLAVLISPFASGFPDGLEWVAGKLAFVELGGRTFFTIFPDYRVFFVGNAGLSTIIAGIAGIAIVFSCTFATGKVLRKERFEVL